MSNDVEKLLTDGMQRTTAGVRMAPGLAGRLTGQAASKHRRRLFTQAGVAGGTALAVAAGFAIAGVLSPATGGTAVPRVQTAAYVISHMNHALASAPAVAHVVATGQAGGQRQTATGWFYQESAQTLTSVYGVPADGNVTKVVSHLTGGTGEMSMTVVYYQARQWRTETGRLPGNQLMPGGSCWDSQTSWDGFGKPLATLGSYTSGAALHKLVSCGDYIVAGRQRVGGVPTIKLVSAEGGKARGFETIWVDASTYLPVRILINVPAFQLQTDVQWLPATPANVAHLRLTIPAGFKRLTGDPVPVPLP